MSIHEDRVERFANLFAIAYGPLTAYARRRAPHDADDLVADVLAIAWRRLDDIPGDAVLPWLYGVARRTLANDRRSTARRARLTDRLAREPVAPAVDTPSGDTAIVEAFNRLREQDREVLRLAAWEQLQPAQIAVVLGCTANGAALRLSRARRRLRAELTGTTARRTQPGGKDTA